MCWTLSLVLVTPVSCRLQCAQNRCVLGRACAVVGLLYYMRTFMHAVFESAVLHENMLFMQF